MFPYGITKTYKYDGDIFYTTKNIIHKRANGGAFTDSMFTLPDEWTITGLSFYQ